MVEIIGLTAFAGIFCLCFIIVPSILEKGHKKEVYKKSLSET